jgi:hypothetical protein
MNTVALDPIAAREVAEAHHAAPRTSGPACDAAYACLVSETDLLFRLLTTGPAAVDIVFTTSERPYDDSDELIRSVRHGRVLEVTSAARDRDRPHPAMGCDVGGAYDRFRAVHDVLGHAQLGVGFDRDGEYATWRFQERFHSPPARRALATELHAEHSVRWTTGELPMHKAVLLDERVIRASRAGSQGDLS